MDKNSSDMEDKIFDIVTDLLRDDISKTEAIDKLLVLSNVKRSYEFYLFSGNQIMVDRDVKELQEQGWELAGDIKPFTGNHGYKGMLIPLKRKI